MKFLGYGDRSSTIDFNSDSPGNMAVVVKINTNENWQDSVASVLSKLEGVHRFELDAEQGTVKILGNLQPDMLMRVLNKSTRNAEIFKAYMTKDSVPVDIFEEPPACPCPLCSPDAHCCNNNNFCHYQLGHYQVGYYDNNICLRQDQQQQALLPSSSSSPYCHGGGYSGGISYYPSLSPPALEYPSAWPPPVHIEPYYEEESSACSIM